MGTMIHDGMDLWRLAEYMGDYTTDDEAREMRRLLVESGRKTVGDFTDSEWLTLCESAVQAVRSKD